MQTNIKTTKSWSNHLLRHPVSRRSRPIIPTAEAVWGGHTFKMHLKSSTAVVNELQAVLLQCEVTIHHLNTFHWWTHSLDCDRSIAYSGADRNIHLGGYSTGGVGIEVPHWGPGAKSRQRVQAHPPLVEAICRHSLQILTAETIKICTFHLLILDQYVSWVGNGG